MMFFMFVITVALLVSTWLNVYVKKWIYVNIIKEELEKADGDEINFYENDTLVFTTLIMILLNNFIPLSIGAIIGLYIAI